MPLYEFFCDACRCRFEALTRIGGESEVPCPQCARTGRRKLVSGFGIGGGGSRIKASGNGCSSCSSGSCGSCH
jgi:putative FmdB family regulatory protein